MYKEDLQSYLIEEAEYNEQEVKSMSPFELVDAYFTWNGVIGFTEDFLSVVSAAYDVELEGVDDLM